MTMTIPAPTTVNGLRLRAILGRKEWGVPRPFGPDGWSILRNDKNAGVLATAADFAGTTWVHASIVRYDETMPTYDDLTLLHRAVFGDGWAYQVFAPRADHVNIHAYALHLWGRADGTPAMPNFGAGGSI